MVKALKDITMTDLKDKFLDIKIDSDSKDVYTHGTDPVLIAIKDNATELSASSDDGVTAVTSAFVIPNTDEAIKDPVSKGSVIVNVYENSDNKKSKVTFAIGTDVVNTYVRPVSPMTDVYRGIKEENFMGEPAIALLQAISESLISTHEINTYNNSINDFAVDKLVNYIVDAPIPLRSSSVQSGAKSAPAPSNDKTSNSKESSK